MSTPDELSRLLGPLRRVVLRRTREAAHLPDLPEAQIELLRALDQAPGAQVREIADRLRIAPSTVSNVVRAALAADLIERRPSRSDRRAVELYLSATALELLTTYDAASSELISAALDHLSSADRKAIERATPALNRLLTAIESVTEAPHRPPS